MFKSKVTYHHLASGMLLMYSASRLPIFELFYSKISVLGEFSTSQVYLLGVSLLLLVCVACVIGIAKMNYLVRILAYVFAIGVLLVFSSRGKYISYGMEQSLVIVCVLGLLHLLLEHVKKGVLAYYYPLLSLAWYCSIVSLIVILETHIGLSLLNSGLLLQQSTFQVNAILSASTLVMLSFGVVALLLTPTLIAYVTSIFLVSMVVTSQNISYLPLLVIALFFLSETLTCDDWSRGQLNNRAYVNYSLVGLCIVVLVAFTFFLRSSLLSVHIIPPILSALRSITGSHDVSAHTSPKKDRVRFKLAYQTGIVDLNSQRLSRFTGRYALWYPEWMRFYTHLQDVDSLASQKLVTRYFCYKDPSLICLHVFDVSRNRTRWVLDCRHNVSKR